MNIGPHKVNCASIDDPSVDVMLAGERLRAIYSDPPWGDGNMKYWATMNKKMTGADAPPIAFTALVDRIFSLASRHLDGYLFIETGHRWQEAIEAAGMERGFHNVRSFNLRYTGGTNVLITMTTSPYMTFTHDPTGGSGAAVARDCLQAVAVPGAIVLDPCCGMGYTARAAVANGMVFRGNELNAARLQKTIDFLSKHENLQEQDRLRRVP